VDGGSNQEQAERGKSPLQAFIPVIDTEGERLASDRIFVRRTPIGYLCAGFGDASRLLHFVFEDGGERDHSRLGTVCRRLEKLVAAEGLAKVHRLGLEIPLGAIDDPHLRRLAIATALLKAGFDPNQARDDRGRWTDEAGGAAPGAATATTPPMGTISVASTVAAVGEAISSSAWRLWSGAALDALPGIASRLTGPLGLLGGLILMPSNSGLMSDGTLPGRPDVAYHASEVELTLYRTNDQGERTPLFVSRPDAEGFYRDEQGNVVGRYVNGAFVLDPSGAAGVLSAKAGDKVEEKETPEERDARIARLVEEARVKVRTADPEELCPDPAADRRGGASERAQEYQEQVTQLPYGVAFYLNGVNFDGCRFWGDKNMLEAKAEGFEQHITPDGGWKPYWKGWKGDTDQMAAQAAAAEAFGKIVEWHVAQKPVADILRAYAEAHFRNVRVIWEPPLPSPQQKGELFVQPPDAQFVEEMHRLAFSTGPIYWIGIDPTGKPIFVPAPYAR